MFFRKLLRGWSIEISFDWLSFMHFSDEKVDWLVDVGRIYSTILIHLPRKLIELTYFFVLFLCSGLNSLNSCLSNGGSIMNNNNNSLLNNNLSSSTETICTSGEQPDPDYIKMFVGQVPKSMDEDQLREMFEEFGRVHSINVLRDKVTGVSKGELAFALNLNLAILLLQQFLFGFCKFKWNIWFSVTWPSRKIFR